MNPKWNPELKKLKKDAHWFIDRIFPDRGSAYGFIRGVTGKCHISELNERELKMLIKKLKKRGLRVTL